MFGERLKELRSEKGYTLEKLADEYNKIYEAGLNKGTLSKYENNKQEPMVNVVNNLASFFGVSSDYLLDRTDKRSESAGNISDQVLQLIEKLPSDKQKDAIDFLEFLVRKNQDE